jgi:hypothetical protein
VKDPREGFTFHYAISNNTGSLTEFECNFGDRTFYDQLRQFFGQVIPLSLRFAARRADLWREYIRYRYRQAALARGLSFFSPTAVFKNTLAYASGTSEADYTHFIDLATQYRRTFLAYLQRKDAFNSRRWFTPDPPDQDWSWTVIMLGKTAEEFEASGAKPEDVANRMAHEPAFFSKFEQFEKEHMSDALLRLPLGDLPAFNYGRLPTGAAVVKAAPEISYLLVLNLVLFLVAFVRFVHYDVR